MLNELTKNLASDEAKIRYETDGYLIFRSVLDADLIGETQNHVAWLIKKHPELRPENLHNGLVRDDPFWVRLISDHRLLDIAEIFIGPDMALFASHYICKPPKTGRPVLWHQDGSYWPLEPMTVITLWLAVTDATPENGCMRVIPGTHHLTLQELRQRQDVENVLLSGMEDRHVDESRAVDIVLKAGDVSIHHPNIIHGSNSNTSDSWRNGLTIRYIPTTTRVLQEPGPLLLRGKAVGGSNTYVNFPRYRKNEHMAFRGCEAWK